METRENIAKVLGSWSGVLVTFTAISLRCEAVLGDEMIILLCALQTSLYCALVVKLESHPLRSYIYA